MFAQTTFTLALAASASAHMVMLNPKPFANSTLNNSPLAPADFPCKQRAGAYNIDLGMNQWNAGETQVVSFMGSAVHGGGSCQFSITTDPEPTKESQWKVIQSVIGNCPSDAPGNLPSNTANDLGSSKFPVKMPSNIPDGRYTFAWTWVNKLGNREFYMNCAPIQVGNSKDTASSASAADVLSKLPDMFVTNLPNSETDKANGCDTEYGVDFEYPEPGQNVVKGSNGVKFGSGLTGTGCAKQNKMGAGAGSIGSPSAGTPSTPPQGTAPSQPSYAPSQPQGSQKPAASPSPGYGAPQPPKIPSNPGGVFAPGASSAPAPAPAPVPAQPAPPAPPAAKPVPSAAPQTPSGENSTAPSNGECTPCTNDGAVVCIGSKQFGLCNRGCAVAQDLAAGMSCSGGAVVASAKRHVHFPRAHLHRRFSAARFL